MDAIQTLFSPPQRDSVAMTAFGYRLHNQFSSNKAYRRMKELQWLEDLRSYKGIYDPDVKIEPGNSKVYPKIPRSKVNIVLSRLHEMLFPATEKNWSLLPTPEPSIAKATVMQIAMSLVSQDEQGNPVLPTADDLNLAIKKYAKETAAKMSSEIDDQFTEMDYPEETKKVLRSGLQYGTGIMKGPLVKSKEKRRWTPTKDGKDYEEQVDREDTPDLQFIRLWDWYPDMTVTDQDKMEGSFERHVMTKHDLRGLAKRQDFYPEMIYAFLDQHPSGNYVPCNWETDLQTIEIESMSGKGEVGFSTVAGSNTDRNAATNNQTGKKYEVLEYWGYVDGSDLLACGLTVDDPSLEYAANVWLLGDRPIKAVLYPAALDQYKLFYYEKDETSIFGEGLIRVMRHSALSIAAGARMVLDNGACVTGDTIVYKRKGKSITIRELWNKRRRRKRTVIRSVDEETGEIFYNRVLGVLNNGVKDVYELQTLNGYKIKATEDHRFMREDGEWQELQTFMIGSLIAVNGRHNRPPGVCLDCGAITKGSGIRCRSCAMKLMHPPDIDLPKECIECGKKTATRGVRCKACAAKLENNSWNRKQADDAVDNGKASTSTARARWSCQKDKKDACEYCGISGETGIRLDVHHRDRNPYNNAPSNKLTLCCTCHRFEHRRNDYIGNPSKHVFVDFDEIVEVKYVGIEEVFDIQMEAPNHNFVANGVIAHNCVAGPQVEVNWSLMTPDTDINSFYPRKIWFREGKGIDAQYPALRVYNIDSHIDELIKIIELFKSFGDEETTLPTWMIGQQVNNETAQATSGRNATVLVSIKDIVKNFDTFTEHIIRDMYAWNMDFNPRPDIKGDFQCKARGVSSLVMKEIRMQALSQLSTTLTPEERDYIPEREFIQEKFKAHDLESITLLSDEEVAKIRKDRSEGIMAQLEIEMAKSEIAKNKAQSMSLLTKSKKANVEANVAAQTPIEESESTDPRVTDEEVALAQTERGGKEAEIRRKEEAHALDMQHKDEQHRTKVGVEHVKTAHKVANEDMMAEHKVKMGEQMTQAGAKAKMIAANKKPAAPKAAKPAKKAK